MELGNNEASFESSWANVYLPTLVFTGSSYEGQKIGGRKEERKGKGGKDRQTHRSLELTLYKVSLRKKYQVESLLV